MRCKNPFRQHVARMRFQPCYSAEGVKYLCIFRFISVLGRDHFRVTQFASVESIKIGLLIIRFFHFSFESHCLILGFLLKNKWTNDTRIVQNYNWARFICTFSVQMKLLFFIQFLCIIVRQLWVSSLCTKLHRVQTAREWGSSSFSHQRNTELTCKP